MKFEMKFAMKFDLYEVCNELRLLLSTHLVGRSAAEWLTVKLTV